MTAKDGLSNCLFACELNPPYAISSNLWAPGPISSFADLRHFAFFDDMNPGRAFLLHDALRIVPAGRGKDVSLRLNGKCHEAAAGAFTLQRGIVPAGRKADDGEGQSASPENHPDA